MSTYASFHVALMHAFLGIFVVLVGLLALGGLVLLAAWINDRWQRRDHRHLQRSTHNF